MSIRVHHTVPMQVAGAFAQQSGQNQAAGQALDADQRRAEFLLSLGQRDRALDQKAQEFRVNTALRVNQQDQEQDRWRTQLAITDATQQRQAYEREADRAADFQRQQMQEEYNLFGQQQQEEAAWYQQQSKSLDEQASEQFKAMRSMKLTPEGERIRNEYSAKFRQIQSEPLRPEAHDQAMGQLMADVERADLASYEVKEPTAEEEVYSGLVPLQGQQIQPGHPLPPGKYRSLKGVRNGVKQYETLDIPQEENLTAAQRLERDITPLPHGGFGIWNSEKKTWDLVDPPKAEKSEAEKAEPAMSARDKVATRKAINEELKLEYEADLEEVMEKTKSETGETKYTNTGQYKHPSGLTFVEYRNKHLQDRIAEWNRSFGDPDEDTLVPSELQGATLSPQLDPASAPIDIDAMQGVMGEADEMLPEESQLEEGETIITNPAGRRAILHNDGTVTPLD